MNEITSHIYKQPSGSIISIDGTIKINRTRWGIIEISNNNGFIIAPFWMKPPRHDVLTSLDREEVEILIRDVLSKNFVETRFNSNTERMLKYLNTLEQKRI